MFFSLVWGEEWNLMSCSGLVRIEPWHHSKFPLNSEDLSIPEMKKTRKVQGLSKPVGLTCHGTGNSQPLILCVSRKINFILPLFSDYNALKLLLFGAGCVLYKCAPNEAINQVSEQKHILSSPIDHVQQHTQKKTETLPLLWQQCLYKQPDNARQCN